MVHNGLKYGHAYFLVQNSMNLSFSMPLDKESAMAFLQPSPYTECFGSCFGVPASMGIDTIGLNEWWS